MGTSLSEKYIFYGKDRTVTRGVFSTWSLIRGMGPRGQCCGANLTPWPSQIYERLSCSPWLRNLKAMALEKWKWRLGRRCYEHANNSLIAQSKRELGDIRLIVELFRSGMRPLAAARLSTNYGKIEHLCFQIWLGSLMIYCFFFYCQDWTKMITNLKDFMVLKDLKNR